MQNIPNFCLILTHFLGKDSAEASAEASVKVAEASVKVAEASVSAESRFRPIRSFTNETENPQNVPIELIFANICMPLNSK